MNNNNKGLSIASMACGIAGCVCCWTGWGGILGLAAAIAGVILSKKAVEAGGENTFNKVGKICGFIGIGLSILGIVVAIICTACYGAAACAASGLGAASSYLN